MSFHAALLNAKPPGEIRTEGQFGPLHLQDVGQTRLSGSYDFQRACSRRVLPRWPAVGLELSARPWKDGDLLGWAYAYEQVTRHRRPPVLVEMGLLPNAR
jgi:hypothetical protein